MDVSCIHTCLSHCKCFVGFAAEGTSSTALPTLKKREGKAQDADLPVFCVSAKDCQRLEGRTSKDGPPSAFTKLEHTEVPQLREHIHHLTGKSVSLLLCCSSKLSKCMRWVAWMNLPEWALKNAMQALDNMQDRCKEAKEFLGHSHTAVMPCSLDDPM